MNFQQLAQSLDPFMDETGETYIHVTIEGLDQTEQIPLNTPWARGVVKSMLCPLLKKGYPTEHETRTALDIIVGYAFSRPRQKAKFSADHQIAQKPLAQAVLALARKGGTTKELPALLAMLTRVAQHEGIDIKKGPWPTNEDALGKQLSATRPILAVKGICLVRNENDRPRTWTIPASMEKGDESDADVTNASPGTEKTSGHPDTSSPCIDREASISDDQIMASLKGEQS